MRTLIALWLAFAALSWTPLQQDPRWPVESGSLKFAVIGDNGTGDRPQYDVGQQLAAVRDTFPFELVIMLGDNMYGRQQPQDFVDKFERPYQPRCRRACPSTPRSVTTTTRRTASTKGSTWAASATTPTSA